MNVRDSNDIDEETLSKVDRSFPSWQIPDPLNQVSNGASTDVVDWIAAGFSVKNCAVQTSAQGFIILRNWILHVWKVFVALRLLQSSVIVLDHPVFPLIALIEKNETVSSHSAYYWLTDADEFNPLDIEICC